MIIFLFANFSFCLPSFIPNFSYGRKIIIIAETNTSNNNNNGGRICMQGSTFVLLIWAVRGAGELESATETGD